MADMLPQSKVTCPSEALCAHLIVATQALAEDGVSAQRKYSFFCGVPISDSSDMLSNSTASTNQRLQNKPKIQDLANAQMQPVV